ncbi:MAG TPA: class C sortase [Ruminococcaceae bacterium]|nr:class C sortase [Oscillospiraceae bacterium]
MKKEKKKSSAKAIVQRVAVIAVFALIALIGLNVLFYPQLSDYINNKNASRAISGYDRAVSSLNRADYGAYLQAARAYNARLYKRNAGVRDAFSAARNDPDRTDEYWSLLNVDNDGMMGYIEIDKIKVKLPIYHGTDDAVLAAGAGHLYGSSLPVGGADTHAVVTAHTGLPSAELFTGLDQLKTGDTFAFHVLGDTYTYRVDRILTVLPDQVDALRIAPGRDYATLVTCTPYGINTHRLLVRGTRIPNPAAPGAGNVQKAPQKLNWFQQILRNIFLAFAGAFEAVVTFFVKIARWVMDLFHIAY